MTFILVAGLILGALALAMWIEMHKLSQREQRPAIPYIVPKESPMPKTHNVSSVPPSEDETQILKAVSDQVVAEMPTEKSTRLLNDKGEVDIPAIPSINDVAAFREQDQALAQLSAQLDSMAGSPWIPIEVTPEDPYPKDVGHSGSPVRKVAYQLTLLCTHPAFAGKQDGTTARGTRMWVDMGDRKIAVPDHAALEKLTHALNASYTQVVIDKMRETLVQLNAYAKGGDISASIPLAAAGYALRCGKTFVMFLTDQERQDMLVKLTAAYHATIKDYAGLVMAEMVRASDPRVGMDLRIKR